MPAWLQSKIKCFYCGRASKYNKNDQIRSFQCASCEGTNYLDKVGTPCMTMKLGIC
ncbi:hypothetical protein K461DRAFT_277933 [Myriangium duriaei CBS 260.36]|uniref:Ima1 N-terminal domain-containing protein n=1 Tax=Myriangium duriaei CBS 260.36 TaxID=1168546 RepID=A0A9P4J4L9_9PEZI|nr:hypothetical protein K461DRAFT_277933 [Myriangium duriaei CBS 260.36]